MSVPKEWVLRKESELRCEVQETQILTLKMTAGSAEIFGVEMAPNKEYTFRDQNIAIYTWYGCTIETSTETGIYIDDSTPMISYVNTHIQLQARRDVALNSGDNGPRVMIVGPIDSGKSTVAQILAAYAVRMDRTPVFVDLDVGQSSLTVPGCISAAQLSKGNLSAEEGFTNLTPLVFFHGHASPKDAVELYNQLGSNLAAKVDERLSRDENTRSSGLIVNTSGWVDEEGQKALLHAIQAFSIDIVLVVGQDKLHSSLVQALSGVQNKTVVKLPKSGGVVTKEPSTRKRLRKNRFKEYFYGRVGGLLPFYPERRENVPISSFTFVRVGGLTLTAGMRIIGDTSSHQDTLTLKRITPTSDLAFSVLAVLNTAEVEGLPTGHKAHQSSEVPQSLLKANVAGFVSILHIDVEQGVMTLLCPCAGSLPSSYLMVGSVKWIEG